MDKQRSRCRSYALYEIDSNFLLCFPKDNTIDGYSKVEFHVYTVSIKDEWLDNHIKTLELKNAEKILMHEDAMEWKLLCVAWLTTVIGTVVVICSVT